MTANDEWAEHDAREHDAVRAEYEEYGPEVDEERRNTAARKVLTGRQYKEITALAQAATKAAKQHEATVWRQDLTAEERQAALNADYAAYEALVTYVAALTDWNKHDDRAWDRHVAGEMRRAMEDDR